MKQRDPILKAVLSFFIPFYILYWSYVTGKEIEQAYGYKAPSIWLLIAPLLLVIPLFIVMFVSLFSMSNASTELSAATGIGFFGMFFLLFTIIIVLSVIYYYKFGGIIEKIAGPSTSRLLLLILFWVFSPVAVYIIQDKLNELNHEQGPHSTPPQSPAAQS